MQPSPSEVEAPDQSQKPPSLAQLLDRPVVERIREHRYRFGQAMVFGLPVLALQLWGYSLSGNDAGRWVPIFQALLSGWVMYVAVAGWLFEGMLKLVRGKITVDLLVALAVAGMYVYSLIALMWIPLTGRVGYRPLMFHWAVVGVIAWTGWSWWRLSSKTAK